MFSFGSTNNNAGGANTGGSLFANRPGSASFSFGQNNANTNAGQAPQQTVGSSGNGFSFGNNQQQSGNTGGALFGATQQNNSRPSGLFGNSTSGTGTTSNNLFGNNVGSTGNTGSSFSTGQQTTGGGLFGSNKPASGGLFGSTSQNTNTSGGLFTSNNNNQTTQGNLGGGLFTNNQNPAGTSNTSGGLFGNNTQNSGGLFGNSNTNSTNASGGLFGNKATNAPASGGLFGNKPNSLGSAGLFGQQNSSAPTTNGLFGNKAQNTASNNGPSLFNQGSTSGGLFGNSNPSQGQAQPGTFGSSFPASAQPSFAWSQSQQNQRLPQQQNQLQLPNQQQFQQQQNQLFQQPQQLQLQQQSNYPLQVQEQVIKCKNSWDPTSSNTKLRTFVYNKINENEALLYNKPPYVTQEEWDDALDKRPAASFTPAEVLGFEGLNQRSQLQRENVAQARTILNQMLEKFTQLQQKHELDTAARITKAQSRNIQIEKRILRLGTQLAILKSRGLPLSVSEEKMWSQFQSLLQRSNDPAGLGKTNELWARLAVLKERAKNISDQLNSTLVVITDNDTFPDSKNEREGHSKRADEEVERRIDKVVETLSNQQRGIAYLNDVLEKDHKTLDKMLKK